MTLSMITLYIECHCAQNHYAECRVSLIVMLNAVKPSAITLNVVMVSVVALEESVSRIGPR